MSMVGCTALTVAEYLGIDSRIGLLNSRWLKTSKKYGQKSDYRRLAPTDFLSVFDILANSLLSADRLMVGQFGEPSTANR